MEAFPELLSNDEKSQMFINLLRNLCSDSENKFWVDSILSAEIDQGMMRNLLTFMMPKEDGLAFDSPKPCKCYEVFEKFELNTEIREKFLNVIRRSENLKYGDNFWICSYE
jgi:hypothetical protein